MKEFLKRVSFLTVSLLVFLRARPLTGETPAYRQLAPMVAIHATSFSDAVRLLGDGLAGAGIENKAADCEKRLAGFCFLPSLAGVDLRRPVRYFLLSQNPPLTLPDQAVILPLQPGGKSTILHSLKERYAIVEGGSVKICSDPVDGESVEPLYVAIAEDNAMLSPNLEAIRWMAFTLQSKTVPDPPVFRRSTISASADAKLLGLLLGHVASLDEDEDVADDGKTPANDIFRHVGELAVFLSAFQRAEVALDASISQWDVSLRLVGVPGSQIAEAIAALKPPDDSWMKLFPSFACNRSASCLPGFVAALPPSNRKWLADLADDTRIVGFGVMPSAFGLDEKLRPFLTGSALSAFVTDKPGDKFGTITVSALKSTAEAREVLRSYFAGTGAASANKRIGNVMTGGGKGTTSYDVTSGIDHKRKSGVGSAGEAVSLALSLNHVEFAVRGDRLVVARGAPGLIDQWLEDSRVSPWEEKFASLTAVFPVQYGETVLGGGSVEPVALVRRIAMAIPELSPQLRKMPHAGNGFSWRMAKKGGEARFDIRLYSNEILALNMLRQTNSDTMQELISQLILRHFQHSAADKEERERIREKLNTLRDK